jgi:hypothetical protein
VTEIFSRLAGLGALTPEIAIELLGMMIDAVGTGAEWSGENLDRLGEMAQQLADKIRGQEGDAAG